MAKPDKQIASTAASSEFCKDAREAPCGPDAVSAAELFGRILETRTPSSPWPIGEPFVAECTDARHPTLQGRVKICWPGHPPDGNELWVPTLHGQSIRKGDRLLVQRPHGGTEPIVLGVIDGFLPRPEPERTLVARIEVKRDETLQVCSQEGQPLIEIVRDEKGPMVRLLQSDTRIDVRGKLSITAAELELRAVKGEVRIQASDDVNLVGEAINLN